jgi:deoxyribose-phosphate aldolase
VSFDLNPAAFLDHTLLRSDATVDEIAVLCEEAVEHQFAAVCVPPVHLAQAARLLYGSEVAPSTVIGFPLGYNTTSTKVFEAARAVEQGAREIDMVIQLGAARTGDFKAVSDEVAAVLQGAQGAEVKVILECCHFDKGQIRDLAATVLDAGAHWLKTSTGFAAGGATLEDVKILVELAQGRAGVKAAGGIRDWLTCQGFIEAGARRIGTSNAVAIVQQWRARLGL